MSLLLSKIEKFLKDAYLRQRVVYEENIDNKVYKVTVERII